MTSKRYYVKVKLRQKTSAVRMIDENHLEIRVNEPPVDGRANQAVMDILSDFFDVPRSCVKIISGHTIKQKIIEIQC